MNNRVAILGAFQNASYDSGDASLLNLVDYIRCYYYPNRGENPRNSIAGNEGDPVYVQVPFRVETAFVSGMQPILGKVQLQIVAVKNGEEDFVVEQWQADVSDACRTNNKQAININNTKGYITYPGDPYNSISLIADPTNDAGTKKAYLLQYGLVLRYDYWTSILTTNPGGVTCNNDISNDNQNVNNSWNNLASDGWSLIVRFYAEVSGYDSTITPFQAQTTIVCANATTAPDAGPAYAVELYYYDINGNLSTSVIPGAKTFIRAIFTSNGVALPDPFNDYYGTVWADLFNGGPLSRRFASTEYVSESGSPFSIGDLLGDVLFTAGGQPLQDAKGNDIHSTEATLTNRTDGNIRIVTYSAGRIVLETIYDDTITGWAQKADQLIIYPRIGFKINDELETADGDDLLTADGQQIIP